MANPMGYQVLHRIADALGLEGRAVRRLIIDIDIDQPVRVLLEEFTDKADADRLVSELQGRPEVHAIGSAELGLHLTTREA
jgi:hypothetical protein